MPHFYDSYEVHLHNIHITVFYIEEMSTDSIKIFLNPTLTEIPFVLLHLNGFRSKPCHIYISMLHIYLSGFLLKWHET